MKLTKHTQRCINEHMGNWNMYEPRLRALEALINSENITFEAVDIDADHEEGLSEEENDALMTPITAGGIMIVPIEGTIMRSQSSMGGTSSVQIRRILRNASTNPKVKAVMLNIDSPGGTVAGTDALAEDIKVFGQSKPIHAHVDGLMASAAFWTGSFAHHITATRTSEIGSLGTVAVVHDMSEAAKKEGIKVHVVSTGPFKGAFAPGSEVTEAQLADLKETVEHLNGFFIEAVMESRGFDAKKTADLFDGRVHVAEKAKGLGLIDSIGSFSEAIQSLQAQVSAGDDEAAEAVAIANANRNRLT